MARPTVTEHVEMIRPPRIHGRPLMATPRWELEPARPPLRAVAAGTEMRLVEYALSAVALVAAIIIGLAR
ncbi:MAG: hypothetical protein ACRDF7_06370 [Candidatus Limnocylindrales bacterium]